MTAFADLSELVNRQTGGNSGNPQHLPWYKDGRLGSGGGVFVASRLTSLWQYNGNPSHGAVPPTSAAVPTNATAGSLRQVNASGGRELWLSGYHAFGNIAGTLFLYDRLLHISGLSGTVTTPQTVGGTLTRYTDGVGVEAFAEINTQVGITATTLTLDYTDSDGNAGQTSTPIVFGGTAFREATRLLPISLAAGDIGIRAAASTTLAATTGTAGDFGIILAKRIDAVPIPGGCVGTSRSFPSAGFKKIQDNACLFWAFLANNATAPEMGGMCTFVER